MSSRTRPTAARIRCSNSTRDYSFCTLAAVAANKIANPARNFSCGGSGTSANGTFLTNVGTFQVQGNKFVPGSTPFNFAPFNYFQRPDERYNFGTFADYEIAPGAHPYLEAMFMDDHTDAQIAPSGDFGNTTTLNCDNPLLSAQERATICQAAVFNPAVFHAGVQEREGGLQKRFRQPRRPTRSSSKMRTATSRADRAVLASPRLDPVPERIGRHVNRRTSIRFVVTSKAAGVTMTSATMTSAWSWACAATRSRAFRTTCTGRPATRFAAKPISTTFRSIV